MSQADAASIQQSLQHLTGLVERMDRRMNGPDDEPEKGIVVRLDRVEQWKARATRIQYILIGSAVTFFATRALELLST